MAMMDAPQNSHFTVGVRDGNVFVCDSATNTTSLLTPERARKFASALVLKADEADAEMPTLS